ncbi:dormancy-associated protein homolog 4-like [Salvia miltiorrhiza]|uniref:dormancy-associated protein homolog 4-like n=1 Tax=Salvia miltiorrhiza TaxID=226208 RepID=UPI0025ACEF28|nr:dormancy-associated protein homolog 4-like [Salvia miltiorrhiza]
MGFLHKLWDETLAGPPPDAGLGKLRKYNSFSAARSTAAPSNFDDHQVPITRSITVVRRDTHRNLNNLNVAVGSPSAPSSPASSTPSSPFSPNSPGGNFKKWMRKKPTTGALHNSEPERFSS